jgi:hypothetical protein
MSVSLLKWLAIINLYIPVLKFSGNLIRGKPFLLLGILLLMIGIQFIPTGIVAGIQMHTYFEAQQKKLPGKKIMPDKSKCQILVQFL